MNKSLKNKVLENIITLSDKSTEVSFSKVFDKISNSYTDIPFLNNLVYRIIKDLEARNMIIYFEEDQVIRLNLFNNSSFKNKIRLISNVIRNVFQ